MRRASVIVVTLLLLLTAALSGCRFSCTDEAPPPVKATDAPQGTPPGP